MRGGVLLLLFITATLLLTFCSCGISENLSNKDENENSSQVSESTKPEDTDNESENESEETEEEEPVDIIDLDSLTAIENSDKCKVKIVKKEVQRDAVAGFTMKGGDALNLTVSNDSNADVTSITVYIVGYTEKNGLASVQPSLSVSFGTVPYIQSFECTDTTIKAGAKEKIGIEVDADKFVGVKAIVASYTTSDGTTYENDIAEDWVNSVQLGKNTVLD